MSDTETRRRPERESSEPVVSAQYVEMQRCIESMRKVAGDLDARVADLESSVGRIGSAFGQMAGLHGLVVGGASRVRPGGAQRDVYNRQDPPRGDHVPSAFGYGGDFHGRGRGRGRR